ncbi:hypothetical protein L0F51_17665 [Afifella sp. H1R]|uniref:DUF6892 domain-containing protein n=1 Tax=Afifella sp. H1R TaxID=2908841 RepID=UPI001F24E5EC|nr:hypothetical protein [Afifella sp. H1R]MCF1505583.1 hypothetical protein [Afifella sp. H1R]
MADHEAALVETVRSFLRAPADDFDAVQQLRAELNDLIAKDASVISALYGHYFQAVHALLKEEDGVSTLLPDTLDQYRFVLAFSSGSFLGRRRAEAFEHLLARHEEHLAWIDRALEMPDRRLCPKPRLRHTGTLGDVAGAMIDIYSWHCPFGGRPWPQAVEAALRVPRLFRAFPRQNSIAALSLLADAPESAERFAEIIRFYVLERRSVSEGAMGWMQQDMLGFYARRDDPRHSQAPTILAKALYDGRSWPRERAVPFVEEFVLAALGLEPTTQEDTIDRLAKEVERQRRRIETNTYRGTLGFSAAQEKANDEERLVKSERELDAVRQDFDGWLARRRAKAVRRVAVSHTTRRALQTVVKLLPGDTTAPIATLLDEARSYAERPRRFAMPKPADKRFKDFGFKLLVIEELMYRRDDLRPRFDVHEFAEEFDKREISVEDDGYAIIPEVARYFRDLAIPDDLLATVERLHQSSGLDGGPGYIEHLFPFWDPGAGDDPVPVTAKAANDLDLVPNLKRISGLENSKPGAKLLKALRARDIELIAEEDGP